MRRREIIGKDMILEADVVKFRYDSGLPSYFLRKRKELDYLTITIPIGSKPIDISSEILSIKMYKLESCIIYYLPKRKEKEKEIIVIRVYRNSKRDFEGAVQEVPPI